MAGLLAVALAFVAEPFVARVFLWILPAAVAVLPALENYAQPGVVTHHVLLLVLVALTAGCVARADTYDTGWGFLAGLCAGFGVWLTPEAMPYGLLCFGLLFLRWLKRPVGAGLAACGAGFIDVLGFGFAIDPPAGGYGVVEIDRLSVVFVALGLAVFCIGILCWRIEAVADLRLRRAAAAAGAVALLGAWLALFPGVAAGPGGLLGPADAKLFFGVIGEMQPVRATASSFAAMWPGIMGLAIAAAFCLARRDWGWWYGLAALAITFALGVKFVRFLPVPAAAGAVLVVLALQAISARYADRPRLLPVMRVALVCLLLAVPYLPADAHRPAAGGIPSAACDLGASTQALQRASFAIVLADVNVTPELLWQSDDIAVGSLYHHGIAGFLRLRAAWRAPGNSAVEPDAVRQTGARFVLACAGAGRSGLVADLPKTTLWDAVTTGTAPPWLVPLMSSYDGYRLYAVAPAN
jgi:hypothetical protein